MQTALHANAEVVRRGYHGFNTADMSLLTQIFHEQSSWHTPGKGSIAGNRKGREAVFGQFGRYLEESGGTFKAELRHVYADADGRVVATHRNSGTRNGKKLDVECCIVFEVKDGQIFSGREFFFDTYAWDEFWA